MRQREPDELELRVVMLAPPGPDAALTRELLAGSGIAAVACEQVSSFNKELGRGAGVALLAEESVAGWSRSPLAGALRRQPSWSDLPVVVLMREHPPAAPSALSDLGNVVLVERPLRPEALLSSLRSALRARRRQYQLRDQLEQQQQMIRHLEETRAELRESERWFQLLAEELPQIVWTASPSGEPEYFNRRLAEYSGRTSYELRSGFWQGVLHAHDLEPTRASWTRCARDGTPWRIEHRLRRHDGEQRWHLTRAVPVRDRAGVVTRWFGTATDIHERREQEERLRESEERLRAALGASRTGTFRWDVRASTLDWDRSLDQLFGLPAGQSVESLEAFFELVHPESRDEVTEALRRSRDEGTDLDLELRIVWPDDSVHWLAAKGRTFLDHAGAPLYMIGACVDITDRQAVAEQLRRSNDALRRSNDDLNQFAYAASHDLQEPMRMVAVYSELLARRNQGRLDDDADRHIGYIVSGARRMIDLLRGLLSYASPHDEHPAPPEHLVSCEDVLIEALANLEAAALQAGAQITHDPLPELPVHRVHLLQVLQNLIGNAIKYRGEAPPRVHVSARPDGHRWSLSVRDNGIGIDPRFAAQAFGLFKRLHGDRFPGTGIGLAICSRVVQRYGGEIRVDPAPEGGSIFSFTLPGR